MMWTLGHPHDYFIAGLIVGVLLSVWVAGVIALVVTTCRDGVARAGTAGLGESSSRINEHGVVE